MGRMASGLSLSVGVGYGAWRASFTEAGEARNPALIATGLAIWGLIIRIVAAASFFVIPVVINSVTPLVNYGAQVQAYATTYKTQLAFISAHPAVVAAAQTPPTSVLADAQQVPPNVLTSATPIPPSVT